MKKAPMLMNHIISGRKKPDQFVIGLIGTHRSVGVTHTGIMIANYLSKWKGFRTAYLEMNDEDDMKHLWYAYEHRDSFSKKEFQIYHTTYYRNVREPDLIKILNEDYEYFIMDFGADFSKNESEFLRCDIKLVIGSLTEWKRHFLAQFIENRLLLPGFAHCRYLIVFGQGKDMRMASRELHVHLDSIGYAPDPFLLNKENRTLFQKIIFPS